MRIGLDFHYNARRFYDGVRTHVESLVRELDGCEAPFEYYLFTPRPQAAEQLGLSGRFRALRSPYANNRLNLLHGYGRACRRHGIRLFCSHYFRPLAMPRDVRTVVMVPDILYERMPQFFPWKLRTQMKALLPLTVRRADHIIAPSEFTRRELVELYGLPGERITVVAEGAEPLWAAPPDPERVADVERQLGLERPYVLALGRLAPIKNIPGMLRALAALRERGRRVMLVLVGGRDPSFPERAFLKLRGDLRLEKEAVLAGSLPKGQVGLLLAGAEMLWLPSYGEGFGIPAVEAMAAGLPVVAGRGGALPETVGDAALLVDPAEPEELVEATLRLLDDRGAREELVRRGRERSKRFTWRRTAEETLAVYRRVLGL